MENILAVYKPKGPSSHDMINCLRRITGVKRIGHAGTLDPLASGVLVVAIGREATKSLGLIQAKEKEYLAEIWLGATSETGDAEGKKTNISVKKIPDLETIEKKIKKFVGMIKQKPHHYSAVKIKGQPAYKLVRQGKSVSLKSRLVEIKRIELIRFAWPTLKLKVTTGPGVYIRSLADDLGKSLKTGAYLYKLTRTRVGDYKQSNALTISDFKNRWQKK